MDSPKVEQIIYNIISIILIIFTILLIITYSKDKYFHLNKNDKIKLYPCYFNIFYCIIIALYNVVRLIPESLRYKSNDNVNNKPTGNIVCQIQAVVASSLDKLIVSLMTIYSIVNYLSVFKSKFYKKHLKAIYITSILIGLLISLTLSIIYFLKGISYKDILCYIHTKDSFKRISDNIYSSILFLINLFCLISLIVKLNKLRKHYINNGNTLKQKKSTSFLKRFILDLFINIVAFTYLFLIINKFFPSGAYKDYIYLLICLSVEIFFTFNESLSKAFIRTLTCNKYKEDKDSQIYYLENELIDGQNEDEDEDED